MNLVDRVKNILLTPKTEWPVIEAETTDTATLYKSYVAPLVGIGAVAAFISIGVIGISIPFLGTHRSISGGISAALLHLVVGLLSVFLIGWLINALAPTFTSQQNQQQALKLAAYAYTPAWIAAVLQILPGSTILALLGGLYGLYLIYIGLPVLMKTPAEKALPYTAVIVICAFVLSLIFGAVMGSISTMGLSLPGVAGIGKSIDSSTGTGSADDKLAKLKEMGDKMEAASKKMADAEKSGDTKQQMEAAAGVLGALAGGAGGVEPVDAAQLKALLPETLGDFKRTEIESQKNGMMGITISNAEAHYDDGQGKRLKITLTDTGGAKGIAMIAGFGMMESEKENSDGYEKIHKVDGQFVKEEFHKSSGEANFTTLVGDRFIVEGESTGLEMDALKKQLAALDLGKLKSLK